MHEEDTSVKYSVTAEVSESNDGGMLVGDYTILDELGHGSFGVVYMAKSRKTGEVYAIKEYNKANLRKRQQMGMMRGARGGMPMRPGRGGLFAARQMLLKQQGNEEDSDPFYLIKTELAISKKLKHPHIARLYEVLNDTKHDVLYLVIDLCNKGPVQELSSTDAKASPLSAEDTHKYFTHALLALEYLHEQGIIHRDIKPDNMLLTEDNVLKLTDFGESIMPEDGGHKVKGASGTPAFMAPELCQDASEITGEPADIWSLGVCLYGFVYGELPFKGSTVFDIIDSISAGEISYPGPYDEQLQNLLSRMMERNPDTRITISEIRGHPWVTQNGTFELPSKEINCQHIVDTITKEDVDNVLQPIFDIIPLINAFAKLRIIRRRIRDKHEAEQRAKDHDLPEDSEGNTKKQKEPEE
ncbi:kinase-like domain-containing protein [Coemansia spiralis]|nr:kinase-like domain-containing protein [Coemansia spiralis]